MSSNLRSKPIEGYVADSAGNVLRNSNIVIKELTPSGVRVVDSTSSDDDGYFKSRPIPSGSYDVYESGIRVARTIHNPYPGKIQCYKAVPENTPTTFSFQSLLATKTLNRFRHFIQIESSDSDVLIYGNSFPIYKPYPSLSSSYGDLSSFLNLDVGAEITTTRFDVELYLPITAVSTTYRRVRWAGIPGIKKTSTSQIVLPLDYFSMVANMPKRYVGPLNPTDATINEDQTNIGNGILAIDSDNVAFHDTLMGNLSFGDIVKFTLMYSSISYTWYGIYVAKNSGGDIFYFEKWQSSRFLSSDPTIDSSTYVLDASAYDGMFSGITNISDTTNEVFTVSENNNAQNGGDELYNYSNIPT